MKRIANRDAGLHAGRLTPFKGSNLFGEALPCGGFVVYSYGPHWPLYIFDGICWYENESRTSASTARHRSQARPYTSSMGYAETQRLPLGEMKTLLDYVTGLTA